MAESQIGLLIKENTELGKIIECKNGTIATLARTRDKLKAENERLKEEIKRLDEDDFCYEVSEIEFQRLQKCKSCLQEIKEMILYCDDEYDCDKCRYHDKCQPNEGEFPDFSKALLQKIAECEVNQ